MKLGYKLDILVNWTYESISWKLWGKAHGVLDVILFRLLMVRSL